MESLLSTQKKGRAHTTTIMMQASPCVSEQRQRAANPHPHREQRKVHDDKTQEMPHRNVPTRRKATTISRPMRACPSKHWQENQGRRTSSPGRNIRCLVTSFRGLVVSLLGDICRLLVRPLSNIRSLPSHFVVNVRNLPCHLVVHVRGHLRNFS